MFINELTHILNENRPAGHQMRYNLKWYLQQTILFVLLTVKYRIWLFSGKFGLISGSKFFGFNFGLFWLFQLGFLRVKRVNITCFVEFNVLFVDFVSEELDVALLDGLLN